MKLVNKITASQILGILLILGGWVGIVAGSGANENWYIKAPSYASVAAGGAIIAFGPNYLKKRDIKKHLEFYASMDRLRECAKELAKEAEYRRRAPYN